MQKVINDTIKEHLFGPDLTSTDENSPHSPESGDEGMSPPTSGCNARSLMSVVPYSPKFCELQMSVLNRSPF